MNTYDIVDLAARNLRESVLRNSLTTIGIAVGVASLVAMLSLGIGLQQLANRRLTRSGLCNSVVVTSHDLERMTPRQRRTEPAAPARALDESARADIRRLAHASDVYPEIRFLSEV